MLWIQAICSYFLSFACRNILVGEDGTSDSDEETDESGWEHRPVNEIVFPKELKWNDGYVGMCLICNSDGRYHFIQLWIITLSFQI